MPALAPCLCHDHAHVLAARDKLQVIRGLNTLLATVAWAATVSDPPLDTAHGVGYLCQIIDQYLEECDAFLEKT